jgi:quercetin dioxygenase-like cupin family protein
VILKGEQPSRMRANTVHLAPGAHTAWHRHAVGKTLHVTQASDWSNPAAATSS